MKSESLTKADTLQYLQSQLQFSVIDPFLTFSLSEWQSNQAQVLTEIRSIFSNNNLLIIRSSTTDEENLTNSLAGYYHSELGIYSNNQIELVRAINKVISSYSKGGRNPDPKDQFIVQSQVQDVHLSGVVITHDKRLNSPYYLINYDDFTEQTNTVTGGSMSRALRIVAWQIMTELPPVWSHLMLSIQEVEQVFPDRILNVEFGIDRNNNVHIFQVRFVGSKNLIIDNKSNFRDIVYQLKESLTVLSHESNALSGSRTILADMSDWNPAEMIGNRPNILDYSLYRFLITNSAWNQARVSIGYTDVFPHELMVLVGDKPYIDTRVSFNSLTPSVIPLNLRKKLVNYYIEKLMAQTHLQDKVEFEIVFTCYDFSFDRKSAEIRDWGFSETEVSSLKQELKLFTNYLLKSSTRIIERDLRTVQQLGGLRESFSVRESDPGTLLNRANKLLEHCRDFGVVPFARLARLAFVGLALFRSLLYENILTQAFFDGFLASISTVATQMSHDWNQLADSTLSLDIFLQRYGHLRPGTYNIIARRYDDSPNFFKNLIAPNPRHLQSSIVLEDYSTIRNIDSVLKRQGFGLSAQELLAFIQGAIEAREYSKFEFTKILSDALELIAKAGDELDFSRDEIALINLDTLMKARASSQSSLKSVKSLWHETITNNSTSKEVHKRIALPPVITGSKDLLIVPYYESSPNFITRERVEGFVHFLNVAEDATALLTNRIVLLENADPGYDWIFTQGLRGLITQYGGAASHMAIRCAEFGLPAAIGCGEVVFSRLRNTQRVLLNCAAEIIVPIY